MIYNSILEAIGNTPMIRLRNMTSEGDAEILVKFEGLNVGGSIKTRTAYNMILDAEARGLLNKDSIIVEPTSGNQGIGLALVGAVRGYQVKIIMPDSVSEERRKLVRHYGAEVILVHDDGNIGLCIEECLALAMKILAFLCLNSLKILPTPAYSVLPPHRRYLMRLTVRYTAFAQA